MGLFLHFSDEDPGSHTGEVLLVRTEQEEEEEKKTWTIEARQISGTEDKSKDRYYLGRLLRPAIAQWAYSCTSPLMEKTPGPTWGI